MRAGDLVEVDFGLPAGSEAGFVRPAVVITADALLEARPRTVQVVPLTTNTSRRLPTEIHVPGTVRASVAQCHLVTTVDRSRVVGAIGTVPAVTLRQIREVLADLIDL